MVGCYIPPVSTNLMSGPVRAFDVLLPMKDVGRGTTGRGIYCMFILLLFYICYGCWCLTGLINFGGSFWLHTLGPALSTLERRWKSRLRVIQEVASFDSPPSSVILFLLLHSLMKSSREAERSYSFVKVSPVWKMYCLLRQKHLFQLCNIGFNAFAVLLVRGVERFKQNARNI